MLLVECDEMVMNCSFTYWCQRLMLSSNRPFDYPKEDCKTSCWWLLFFFPARGTVIGWTKSLNIYEGSHAPYQPNELRSKKNLASWSLLNLRHSWFGPVRTKPIMSIGLIKLGGRGIPSYIRNFQEKKCRILSLFSMAVNHPEPYGGAFIQPPPISKVVVPL